MRVTLCGDGTALCARLISVSGDARTAENLQLLNRYVVQNAALEDTGTWSGEVHFNGQTVPGKISMVSNSEIKVSGCQMGLCKTFEFYRRGGTATVADASL